MRDMWVRIQERFATVINNDVNQTSGKFHAPTETGEETLARMKAQGDSGKFTIDGVNSYN